jgi:uncharacterized membrane protein
MKHFVDYIFGIKGHRFKSWPGLFLNMGVLGGAYYLVSNKPIGWLTYWLIAPPCSIILLTAIARVNDMSAEARSWKWHLRKLGFILSGTAAVAYLTIPFTVAAHWPAWSSVMLAWGVATAWLTTPNMIPWWRYISGEFRKKDLIKMAEGEKTNVLTK